MLFTNYQVVIRGGGNLATGIVYRLWKAGFPMLVLELARPLPVRRRVAVAAAILENEIIIEDLTARRAASVEDAKQLIKQGIVPVLVAPEWGGSATQPSILIDARMAKRNIDTQIDQADLVIGLGPGFTAGADCHAVIETMRGHRLGRVIWHGCAMPNTGTPGIVAGKGAERVLRAPAAGIVKWRLSIGDRVQQNALIGEVAGVPISAPFDGVIRGLIAEETAVWPGLKIGDVDARADRDACFTISDKALAVGGGVLEAILTHLNKIEELRTETG